MKSVLSRQEYNKKVNLSEKVIHTAVIAHWRAFGVPGSLVATIPNMRAHGQAGLTPGLSDLIVIAPKLPIGFIELKRTAGNLTEAQEMFGALCDMYGIPWEVTYGRDEPIALLEKWGAVKRGVRQ